MNLFKKTLLSLAFAFSTGAANAEVILDTITAAPGTSITTSGSFSFSHDITDGLTPYLAKVDKIISAFLTIVLEDPNKDNETFTFQIGSADTSQTYSDKNTNNGTTASYEVELKTSLADLINDGLLSVVLSAQSGEYQFVSSTLTANVERAAPANAVPEPTSTALLGLGLLAVASARRKFAKK